MPNPSVKSHCPCRAEVACAPSRKRSEAITEIEASCINTKGAKRQNMLDATALAIGTKHYSGMTKSEIEASGREFFLANMYGGPKDNVEFDFNDDVQEFTAQEFAAEETSDGSSKLISVTSTIDHEGLFIGFSSNWQTKRRSYVRLAPGQPAASSPWTRMHHRR
jgi:hypothetical protein